MNHFIVNNIRILICVLALLLSAPLISFSQSNSKEIIYIGTFSERGSMGIYVLEFDRSSENLSIIQTITSKKSPNYLAVSPDGRFLFSVNSQGLDQMPDWGSVTSYAIDPKSGKLTIINDQPSYGKGACHVSVYPSGKWIFVSNYGDGIMSVLPVTQDGQLGASSQRIQLKGSSIDPKRQKGPHTHSAIPTADGSFLYVSDLGIDKVMIYRFNNGNGTLIPAKQPFEQVISGSGPRHFVMHTSGEMAFLAEEISSTLNVFKVNPNDGSLTSIFRKSTLPAEFTEYNKVADIHLSPSGNNVYVSNRGHNSIAIFDVVAETGQVKYKKTVPSGGKTPRNFMIDPMGQFAFVANQDSDTIVIFDIDGQGILTHAGKSMSIPSPVCVEYLTLE